MSHDGGDSWAGITGNEFQDAPVTDLAVSPYDPNVVFAATSLGLFRTKDGGVIWSKVSSLSPNASVRTVGVSPADPKRLLAGIPGQGLFLSEDGGLTWRQSSAGLEPNGSHRDVIFDPTSPMIVFTSDLLSGVYRSEDGGKTWVKLREGLTHRAATSLSISSDGLHLYTGTSGGGVFRLDLNGIPPQPVVAATSPAPTPAPLATEPLPPSSAATQPTAPVPTPQPPGGGLCGGAVAFPSALAIAGILWRRMRHHRK